MMRRRNYSAEFKAEAVKLVIDTSRPVAQVARESGVVEQTLGNWVSEYRREHAGDEPDLSVTERARLRELEREIRDVKIENDFLKRPQRTLARSIGERPLRVHRRRVRDQSEDFQPVGLLRS